MDPSAAAEPELAPARTTDNEAQGDDDDDSIAELLDNLYAWKQSASHESRHEYRRPGRLFAKS